MINRSTTHYSCLVHPVLDINNNNQKTTLSQKWFKADNRTLIYQFHTNYFMYNITSSARTWHMCNRNISGQHTPKWNSRRIWNHSKITFEWKLVTWSPSREGTGCALVKQRPQYVRFNVKNWNMQMSSGFSQYLQNICEISPGFNLDIPISHV